MNLANQILEGLVCIKGEVGKDFIFYETVLEMMKRVGMSNPYRNPDKPIWRIFR